MVKASKSAFKTKTLELCPFCGGKPLPKYYGIRDRLDTTTQTFSVSECRTCQTAFLNPMPTGDASAFYPTHYLSGEEEAEPTSNQSFDLEQWYRYNQYKYDFGLFARAVSKNIGQLKSYVDIGCGSGERVTFARLAGCTRAAGVDKFDFAKNQSKQQAELVNSDILDFKPKQKFQVASLFHVLEHVEHPHEILAHISRHILAKDGYLIVQVPNYASFERRLFGAKWFGLDVPRHLWDFNETALVRLLEETGFKAEAVYKKNAPLHPVSIAPSILRDLDVQRIWVSRSHGPLYKKFMKLMWAAFTVLTIPVAIGQNLFNNASMLTVIASNSDKTS